MYYIFKLGLKIKNCIKHLNTFKINLISNFKYFLNRPIFFKVFRNYHCTYNCNQFFQGVTI